MVIPSFNVFGQLHCARDYLAFFLRIFKGTLFSEPFESGPLAPLLFLQAVSRLS